MADFLFSLLLTFDATLRVATPLVFCAIAGLFAERSGVIDLSLEGKMLVAAFAAASMSAVTGPAWLAPRSGNWPPACPCLISEWGRDGEGFGLAVNSGGCR